MLASWRFAPNLTYQNKFSSQFDIIAQHGESNKIDATYSDSRQKASHLICFLTRGIMMGSILA